MWIPNSCAQPFSVYNVVTGYDTTISHDISRSWVSATFPWGCKLDVLYSLVVFSLLRSTFNR